MTEILRRDEIEPDEDAITTDDMQTFWQYGKIVLQQFGPRWRYRWEDKYDWMPERFKDDYLAALREYMNRVQFWPDVWFISDHGNAHRIDLTEGK